MLDRPRNSRAAVRSPDKGRSKPRPLRPGASKAGRRTAVVDPAADTRARILQAAEALFAEDGFDAVSMRDITATANVNLASVNYHFGSKLSLLAEVVASRANLLVEERLRALGAVPRDRKGRPDLEGVVAAFLRPALEMSRQPGGVHHMRLRARLAVERIGMTKSQFEQIFDASNQKFVDALALALPHLPRTDVYWGFHCLLGVVVYTMANSGRIEHLSDGACDPGDVDAALARLVPFIAQGFKALEKR